MNDTAPIKYGMGAPVRRKEDRALVIGAGHFTDDYTPAGTLRAYVVRSTMAHAKITVGGLDAARAMPGVQLILTGADVADIPGLPCKGNIRQVDGTHPKMPKHPLLCLDIVRHVGDPIAFIVAGTLDRRGSRPSRSRSTTTRCRCRSTCRRRWKTARRWSGQSTRPTSPSPAPRASRARPTRRSSGPRRVSRMEIVNNRLVANYLETRGVVAEYDGASERYTLTMGTQGGHGMRDRIAKDILGIPKDKMRIITPDVGGGFGTKSFCYQEYPLAAIAAKKLGRPVKWISDRNEHFLMDAHGRDNFAVAEMAMDENGRFLAMRVDLLAGMGAYLSQYGPFIPEGGLTMLTGLYEIPNLYALCRGIYTHTTPGRCLSRRRPSRGGLSGRAPGRPVRPRHRPRPDRDPPPELHPAGVAPLRDAGRAHLQLRRVQRPSRPRPRRRRLEGLRRPRRRGQGERQGPRLRHRHLCRGLRLPRQGGGDGPAQRRRLGHHLHRHPDQRPGPRHRLCPVRRRPHGARLRQDPPRPGRHRPGPERRGHRRLALDPARRGIGQQRRGQARRPGQASRRRAARDGGRRPRTRPPAASASPAPTAPSPLPSSPRPPRTASSSPPSTIPSSSRSRPTPTAPTSPRSRSIPRPASPRSSTTSSSTISARR